MARPHANIYVESQPILLFVKLSTLFKRLNIITNQDIFPTEQNGKVLIKFYIAEPYCSCNFQ